MRLVRPDDQGATDWLEKVGFFDALVSGSTIPDADSVTVALHAIDPSNRNSTVAAIEHISSLLRRHAQNFAGDVLHSTQVALSEVIENVSKHSRLTTPGFVCGQYHPSNHMFSLSVADPGIGLRESFGTGPYLPARERLAAGDDPRDLAVEPLMSSKYGMGHSGYGLFYSSELCSLASGLFLLSSDDGTLQLEGGVRQLSCHRPWPGTIVNMMLDTSVPVSGSKIWEKLPSDEDEDEWFTTFVDSVPPPFIALHFFGKRLYTRDAAKEIRLTFRERLLSGIPISIEQVTMMTPSFADELFRVLFEDVGEEAYRRVVKVAGASTYIKRLIELVLKNRPSARASVLGGATVR